MIFIAALTTGCHAFQSPSFFTRNVNRQLSKSLHVSSKSTIEASKNTTISKRPCFYRNHKDQWKKRIELDSLSLNQPLECTIPSNAKLLVGKTGNKVFCECGVCTYKGKNNNYKLVFGMLRLDRKESAARKKLQKLKSKPCFSAYVSRIRPCNDEFEISLVAAAAEHDATTTTTAAAIGPKVSVSRLRVGQQVIGRVERVEPYGVLVSVETDAGTVNRHGLVHVQRVADLFGHYINKEQGLKDAGLGRGERIRLQVASVESKRLFLDFTDEVKEAAAQEREERRKEKETKQAERNAVASPAERVVPVASSPAVALPVSSTDASVNEVDQEDDYDDDEDEDWDEDEDYDEDRDIEDQLGLGTY
ncbi:hypothetical protein MPSEU_000199200 [Mayamaea pseudoterrestris]|nr:hypothetical protein MPSEU_000199200 [Mayamaea pseudoterrestris]